MDNFIYFVIAILLVIASEAKQSNEIASSARRLLAMT